MIGWWYGDCGLVNPNGMNYDTQINEGYVNRENWYKGIAWYSFFPSATGRGASLEIDGGSWASFKGTEIKISTTVFSKYPNMFFS